jgi:hypothetical protein
VLDQIKYLRKQLEEDEQAELIYQGRTTGGDTGEGKDDVRDRYRPHDEDPEEDQGWRTRYGPSGIIGIDGLEQMVDQYQRDNSPKLLIQT